LARYVGLSQPPPVGDVTLGMGSCRDPKDLVAKDVKPVKGGVAVKYNYEKNVKV
jgi:hypothetical protein